MKSFISCLVFSLCFALGVISNVESDSSTHIVVTEREIQEIEELYKEIKQLQEESRKLELERKNLETAVRAAKVLLDFEVDELDK